jgi:hypothetical protein
MRPALVKTPLIKTLSGAYYCQNILINFKSGLKDIQQNLRIPFRLVFDFENQIIISL